eukprot:365061-Chlamydomonas_euryale.AAC.4
MHCAHAHALRRGALGGPEAAFHCMGAAGHAGLHAMQLLVLAVQAPCHAAARAGRAGLHAMQLLMLAGRLHQGLASSMPASAHERGMASGQGGGRSRPGGPTSRCPPNRLDNRGDPVRGGMRASKFESCGCSGWGVGCECAWGVRCRVWGVGCECV